MNFRISPKVQRLFSTKLWYVPMLATAMGLMFVRLAVLAGMLPVKDFAAYSAGLLVSSSFCMLACFGLQSLLQRDLPLFIFRKRERAGEVLLMQCTIAALLAAIVGLILMNIVGAELVGLTTIGLSAAIFHGLSQQLFTVATIDSRSRNKPVHFALQNLQRAIPITVVGPIVIIIGGDPLAILVAEASLTLIVTSWIFSEKFKHSVLSMFIAASVGWRRVRYVNWYSALTLLAVSSLGFMTINVDRWVAARWLSPDEFGQYAFAWTLLSVAQAIQSIINASTYQALSQEYALLGRQQCFSRAVKYSIFTICLIISAFLIFYPLVIFFIENIFEKYKNTINIIPIFIGIFILRVSDFFSSYFIISGQEKKLLYILFITTTFSSLTWASYFGFGVSRFSLISISTLALMISMSNYAVIALVSWWSTK